MQKELQPVAYDLRRSEHDRTRTTQNPTFKFAPSPGNFYPDPYVRENGSGKTLNLRDQSPVDNLKEYIESSEQPSSSNNNNNTVNSFSRKMATSNSSGSTQTANANGYQMPAASTAALPSRSVGFSISPSGHFNNQMSPLVDSSGQPTVRSTHAHINPNPANMKFLAANQLSQGSVLPSQYNQYNTTQEMLLRGYTSTTEDIPGAPRAQQYGTQQRWTESTGLNRQTTSPFSQSYFSQDSHNSLSGSRNTNSQAEDRNMMTKQHYHWPQQGRSQTAFGQANSSSNSLSGASMNRTQMEQPSLPPRQAHYNMMMGASHQQQQQQQAQQSQLPPQQQQQQQHPYMIQPGMKPNQMHQSHKYYGNMGVNNMGGVGSGAVGRHSQSLQNQMQKPPDYASYQQQQMQHRYHQQHVQYSQQRQQPYSSNMQRLPSSLPQPILPKPSSGNLYGSPSQHPFASTTPESGVPGSLQNKSEFPGSMLSGDQQQQEQQQQHIPTSYSAGMSPDILRQSSGRSASSQARGYPPYGGTGQGARHPLSPSPMGSPMRSMTEMPSTVAMTNFSASNPQSVGMRGYPSATPPPSVGGPGGPIPGPDPSTNSIPSTSLNSGFEAAAAAAAAVLAAANNATRFGSPGQSPLEQPGQSYMPGSQDLMLGSKGPLAGNSTSEAGPGSVSSSGVPSLHDAAMMGNAETGTVPSPTLNELPTAEDVEAMIESMRAGETSLSDSAEQPSVHGSAPPSVPSPAQTHTSQNLEGTNGPSEAPPHGEQLSPVKNARPTSPAVSSMSSPFSGLTPVASPGVSISPTFADADFDFSLSPSMTANDASLPYQQIAPQVKPAAPFEKFSKLYELSSEPGRKEFLDHYQSFMEEQGSAVNHVPVIMKQPLDLYKFHIALRDRGGGHEVARKKLWHEVVASLDLSNDANCINALRNHYTRYLQAYEFRFNKSSSLEGLVKNDLLIEPLGMPPNATVTCSEAIIPRPSGSYSHNSRTADSPFHGVGVGVGVNDSQPMYGHGYDNIDSLEEAPFDSGSKGYTSYNDSPGQQTPSSPYALPQYQFPGGERRNSVPNLRRRYSPFMAQQYSGSAPYSQFPQPSGQQPSHPAVSFQQHAQFPQRQGSSMIGSQPTRMPSTPNHDPLQASWTSQYGPSAETEHLYDYPAGSHGGRGSGASPNQFPAAPPYSSYPGRQQSPMPPYVQQYRASPVTHSPLPSVRQSVAAPQQVASKMKYQQVQPQHSASLKRPSDFPTQCVESTRPIFTKKRKLTSRDLGPVEAWRVMMSLKSGLLSETTWALDTLNILLYDDQTVGYFMLAHLPGLLDNLIDHFRRYLIDIFGTFVENEVSVGAVLYDQDDPSKPGDNAEHSREVKIIKDACRSYTSIITTSSFDDPREGFVSGSSDWIMGGGDTTIHIQSHLGNSLNCGSTKLGRYVAVETDSKTSDLPEQSTLNEEFTSKLEPGPLKDQEVCTTDSCSSEVKAVVKQEEPINCKVRDLVSPSEDDKVSRLKSDADQEDIKPKLETVVKEENSVPSDSSQEPCDDDEQLTARLMNELDLDVDSVSDDPEVESYIESHVTNKDQVKPRPVEEEEACGKEDAPLCLPSECQDAVSRRCVCVSNILRGLSFVPGNDAEMSRHPGLLLILGRLLLLHHTHNKRVPYRHSYLQDEVELECPRDDQTTWWWHCLEALRENALVVIANVAGQMDLSCYPEAISLPLLDGVLHWSVCKSAAALDPMPTATPGTSLSPKQLVLEVLAKMSILEGNVDLILATPPASRLDNLYAVLVRLLTERDNPVSRELALVLLSNLTQAESSFVSIGDKKPCISTLLEFIEDAASSMTTYSSEGRLVQAGFHTESFCGTSVDMLKRAASTLVSLAKIHANRSLFLPFQERILALVTSRILDRQIVSHLAMVLFYLSR